MEMFIIAIVAIVAFAAALYPLMKGRGSAAGDADEFAGADVVPPAAAPTTRAPKPVRVEGPPAAEAPQSPGAPEAGEGLHPPEADPVTGEGIVPPMAAGPATPVAPIGLPHDAPASTSDDEREQQVARYRAALRAGTICRKCGEANVPESRFCADCGAALPLAESHEFE
jgi:hypothetical protein